MDSTLWLFDETSLPQGFVHVHTNMKKHSFHGTPVFPA